MRLVLMWSLVATMTVAASGAPPSATSLAHCPQACGDLNIWYPFGIGPGCFRPGFELTCNHAPRPAKLFLGNTTTQVTDESSFGGIFVSVIFNIAIRSVVDTYNLSWESGKVGRNFEIDLYDYLVIIGCGIEAHMYNPDTNALLGYCTIKCVAITIMQKEAVGQYCYGLGCCTIPFPRIVRGFKVTIIQKEETETQPIKIVNASTIKTFLVDDYSSYQFSMGDLLSDKINTSTIGASSFYLRVVITDQLNCTSAQMDKTRYACGNNTCHDVLGGGYYCTCPGQFDDGNPYLLGGCDQEYNPIRKKNCSESCGNTNISFPFGLKPECSANRKFQLNSTSSHTFIGRPPIQYQVTNISLDEGLLYVNLSDPKDGKLLEMDYYDGSVSYDALNYFDIFDFLEQYGIWRWVVTNITCEMAKSNRSYACLSANSECLNMIHGKHNIGYRCKCSHGYKGNPYVHNGCEDINECLLPNCCNETCTNLDGNYACTSCAHGTSFDPVKRQCTSTRQHNLLLGVAIGLGCGFGVLVLTLSTIVLVQRWKRGIQKKIRRAYFRKNKGLFLEQLISIDESMAHNTKTFSLEEMEKATNNFDLTRILGCGGHGTVYKGILSDQRVVAIKKSKIVEQCEIDQFVNEVAILSQIIHRNVVKLFGCCLESEVPLLVYEFIPNGTLYDLLHGDLSSKCILTWDDRIRIALEVAGALAYLYSAASIPIFHRDVKSANILLDNNFTTKVSDFGASRSISIDETHLITIVQGTFGYLDPEYYHTGKLIEKSDVYSFGVILIELLTRKKPIFLSCFGAKQNLCHYFLQGLRDKTVMEIVDAQVVDEASQEEIDEMVSLSSICLSLKGETRPTMKEVELRLQILRVSRTKRFQKELQKDIGAKPLLLSQSNFSSPTQYVEFDQVSKLASQSFSRCYTMEQELVSWTEFPR